MKDNIDKAEAPRIAVIIPIFRHSTLVSEAIDSALFQNLDFPIRIVLVNDGCPHLETDQVCRDYANAFPEKIAYVRKPNGGLSDARNTGIRFALDRWDSVDAIYMLDADNRLRPTALGNALNELDAHPEAGWIYPHIDMFGLPWAGDYGGDYSLLIHTVMNICEAGSLIRRSVFEAGVFFDTEFKSGFEDWEFFVSAASAGFTGRNIENFGFLYRKRPESMLADSTRDESAILAALRAKHKLLMRPRSLVQMEQVEAPRYAIVLSDCGKVLLTTDPQAENAQSITFAEYERMFWNAQISPSRHHTPPLLIITTESALLKLRESKMLHGAIWNMENMLHAAMFAGLNILPSSHGRCGYELIAPTEKKSVRPSILMVRHDIAGAILRDSSVEWAAGLTTEPAKIDVALLRLRIPSTGIQNPVPISAAHDFVSFASRVQASPYRSAASQRWDWRDKGIGWRSRTHEIPRVPLRGGVAYPRCHDGRHHMGFALPLVEFGGVEKVALNIARAMRNRGVVPHLFVLEAKEAVFDDDWASVFESITFLGDQNFATWGGAYSKYLGTDIPDWATSGDHSTALGMFCWLDSIVNFHGGAISGVMGQLKRMGIKTALSLHLSDQSPVGRLAGNTYLGLAFEHAYDVVLPCSEQLGDWCHAMGIPHEKVVPVVNAPSFELPEQYEGKIAARRNNRKPTDPLRVLYLGRLDRQKGLERLTAVLQATVAEQLPIEWRIIGKSVLSADVPPISPDVLERLEKPLTSAAELAKAYEWADVVILLSSYEGLPLTILEAMRSGAIPLATDVGAVAEVVRHGENGWLVPIETAVEGALEILRKFAKDAEYVKGMSQVAVADGTLRCWGATTETAYNRLVSKGGLSVGGPFDLTQQQKSSG